MTESNKKAIVLLSGGLDSATTLAMARNMGFDCYAMTFRYGQRHEVEIACSERVAESMGVIEQRIIDIDLGHFENGSVGGEAVLSNPYLLTGLTKKH